jgi:hypothetical protein
VGRYWITDSGSMRAGLPLPGRPPTEGPRWRPLEWSNTAKRPADLAAYLRQFTAMSEGRDRPRP